MRSIVKRLLCTVMRAFYCLKHGMQFSHVLRRANPSIKSKQTTHVEHAAYLEHRSCASQVSHWYTAKGIKSQKQPMSANMAPLQSDVFKVPKRFKASSSYVRRPPFPLPFPGVASSTVHEASARAPVPFKAERCKFLLRLLDPPLNGRNENVLCVKASINAYALCMYTTQVCLFDFRMFVCVSAFLYVL